MTAFVSNTDDAIVSPLFFAFISVHWRSLAVETQVFSPFSVPLTLRSGHGDVSLFRWLRPGARTSCPAEPTKKAFEQFTMNCSKAESLLADDCRSDQ